MAGIQKWLEFLKSPKISNGNSAIRGAMIQKFSLKDLEASKLCSNLERLKSPLRYKSVHTTPWYRFTSQLLCVARTSPRTHWSISMSRSQAVRFTAKVLQVATPRRDSLTRGRLGKMRLGRSKVEFARVFERGWLTHWAFVLGTMVHGYNYITCQIIKPELYNYDKKQSLEAQQDQLCEEFVCVPCSVWSENLMESKPKVGL